MGILDKFKKKAENQQEITETDKKPDTTVSSTTTSNAETVISENNVPSEDAVPSQSAPSNMITGVLAIVQQNSNGDITVSGRIKGTARVGTAVYITNCGDDDAPTFLSAISSIVVEKGGSVSEASDCFVALTIAGGAYFNIKTGTVLYSGECSKEEIRNAYINALGDVYVGLQRLQISDKDIETLSLADLAEIWHLFIWHQSQSGEKPDEESRKQYGERQERLVEAICKKLLTVKEIYCIYSKATGEPYMFSKTIKQENGYMCTTPHILLFTKSMSQIIIPSLSEEKYGVMPIRNGEDGRGIYNFLEAVCYLNGANEVAIQVHNTSIPAPMLVPKPDYGNTPQQNIPVTNPDVVRWMLLLGQLGMPEGADEELIYRLYYHFMTKELSKAKFLIPMQHDGQLPKGDENGKTTIKKDTQIKIATMQGKGERPAVRMYTDWRHFKMAYGEEWSGMVESIDNMIKNFDCAINVTKYPRAGCYVSRDMYESIGG